MRALSVRQPWADLIVDGKRTLEIRKWRTPHRGAIAIHAAKSLDRESPRRFDAATTTFGAIIGVASVTKIEQVEDERRWEELRTLHLEEGPRPYGAETYAWFLEESLRLAEAVPLRGSLGLFTVPDSLIPRYRILKNGAPLESFAPGRYAGHRPGKIFGRLDCKTGTRMRRENRVFFLTWEDAIASGYRPCKKCSPTPDDRYVLRKGAWVRA